MLTERKELPRMRKCQKPLKKMEELLRKVEGYRQKIFEKNHFHHSRTQYKHSQPQQQEATCRPLRPGKTSTSFPIEQLPSKQTRGFIDFFIQVGAGGGGGPPAPASVALTYSSASVIVTSDRHHGPQAARYINHNTLAVWCLCLRS